MISILQMCTPGKDFADRMGDFAFWEAVTCQYTDPVGFFVVGALVYTGVALPIYIRTNSITIPAILLLIIGGLVVPQMAGVATPIVTIVIVMAVAGSLAYLYYAYSR